MFRILIKVTFFLILTQISYQTNNNFHVSKETLENFIKTVKEKSNMRMDPCNNFISFACGNIPRKELPEFPRIWLDSIYSKILTQKPKTEYERKVDDFFRNCVNVAESKTSLEGATNQILEQIGIKFLKFNETESNPNSLAQIFIDNWAISYENEPMGLYVQGNELKMYNDNHFSSEHNQDIEKILKAAGMEDYVSEVQKFYLKISNLSEPLDYNRETYNSQEDFKKEFSTKNFDWDLYFKLLKETVPELKESVRVSRFDTAQEVIKAFNETEPHIIYNYYVCKLVIDLATKKCYAFQSFSKFAFLNRIWEDNFKDAPDSLDKYITFLNESENNLKYLEEKYKLTKIDEFYNILNDRKHTALHFKDIISDKFLDDYYGSVNIGSDYYYKNVLTISRIIDKYAFLSTESNKLTALKLYENTYEGMPENIINQPYINLFASKRNSFWKRLLRDHSEVEEINNFENCFKKSNSYAGSGNVFTFRVDLRTIFNMTTDKDTSLYAENELLNDINDEFFDFKKLYFTAYTQSLCEDAVGRSMNVPMFRDILQSTPEFSDVFNCNKYTYMYTNNKCEIVL